MDDKPDEVHDESLSSSSVGSSGTTASMPDAHPSLPTYETSHHLHIDDHRTTIMQAAEDEDKKEAGVDNPGFNDDEDVEKKPLEDTPKSSKAKKNNGVFLNSPGVDTSMLTEVATPGGEPVEKKGMAEAVNLELVNMTPYKGEKEAVNGIPVKKEDGEVAAGNYQDAYDEYFVPVNEHRKYMRGEKLYVTQDKRRTRSNKKCICWGVGFVIIGIAILVAILAGTGVILSQEDNMVLNESSSRQFGNNNNDLKAAGFGNPPLRPANKDVTSSTPQPPNTPVPVVPPTTDMSPIYVPRVIEGELVIDNMEFNPLLADPESKEYKALAAALEMEIKNALFDQSTLNYGAADIFVKVMDFSSGSVVVKYRVGWVFKEGIRNPPQPLDKDQMRERLEAHLQRYAGFLDTHHLTPGSVRAGSVINACQFNNGDCSHECVFDYASRLNFKCMCPTDMVLDSAGKKCVASGEPSAVPEPASSEEPKSEPEPTSEEPKSEPEPTTSEEPKSEPEPTSSEEPKSEPEPTSSEEPKAEPAPSSEEPKSEPEPTTSEEPKSEPEPTTSEEPKSEPEPASEEPKSEPEPTTTSEEPKSEPEPKSPEEPKFEHSTTSEEPKSEPEPASEEPKSEPEPASEEPKSEPEPTSEPEPSSSSSEHGHVHLPGLHEVMTTMMPDNSSKEAMKDGHDHVIAAMETTTMKKKEVEVQETTTMHHMKDGESHSSEDATRKVVAVDAFGMEEEVERTTMRKQMGEAELHDKEEEATKRKEMESATKRSNGLDAFGMEEVEESTMRKEMMEESTEMEHEVFPERDLSDDMSHETMLLGHKGEHHTTASPTVEKQNQTIVDFVPKVGVGKDEKKEANKTRVEYGEDPRLELATSGPVISMDGDFWDYHQGRPASNATAQKEDMTMKPSTTEETKKKNFWFEDLLYPESENDTSLNALSHDDYDNHETQTAFKPYGKNNETKSLSLKKRPRLDKDEMHGKNSNEGKNNAFEYVPTVAPVDKAHREENNGSAGWNQEGNRNQEPNNILVATEERTENETRDRVINLQHGFNDIHDRAASNKSSESSRQFKDDVIVEPHEHDMGAVVEQSTVREDGDEASSTETMFKGDGFVGEKEPTTDVYVTERANSHGMANTEMSSLEGMVSGSTKAVSSTEEQVTGSVLSTEASQSDLSTAGKMSGSAFAVTEESSTEQEVGTDKMAIMDKELTSDGVGSTGKMVESTSEGVTSREADLQVSSSTEMDKDVKTIDLPPTLATLHKGKPDSEHETTTKSEEMKMTTLAPRGVIGLDSEPASTNVMDSSTAVAMRGEESSTEDNLELDTVGIPKEWLKKTGTKVDVVEDENRLANDLHSFVALAENNISTSDAETKVTTEAMTKEVSDEVTKRTSEEKVSATTEEMVKDISDDLVKLNMEKIVKDSTEAAIQVSSDETTERTSSNETGGVTAPVVYISDAEHAKKPDVHEDNVFGDVQSNDYTEEDVENKLLYASRTGEKTTEGTNAKPEGVIAESTEKTTEGNLSTSTEKSEEGNTPGFENVVESRETTASDAGEKTKVEKDISVVPLKKTNKKLSKEDVEPDKRGKGKDATSQKSDRLGEAAGFDFNSDPYNMFEDYDNLDLNKDTENPLKTTSVTEEASTETVVVEEKKGAENVNSLSGEPIDKSIKEDGVKTVTEEAAKPTTEETVKPVVEEVVRLEPARDIMTEEKATTEVKPVVETVTTTTPMMKNATMDFPAPQLFSKCASGQFQCVNGTSRDGSYCVGQASKCDSISDCTDGSDEAGCVEQGCPGNFQCANGQCLKRNLVCNHIVDCNDGSDELACEKWQCQFDEFQCPSGRCIPVLWQCDGKPDCDNHTDEYNCQTTCGNNEYLCPEGWCIPLTWRCNGVPECAAGEDEKLCDCSVEQFKCQTGGCVPSEAVCDGVEHCADASDEWDCVRLKNDSMQLEIRRSSDKWSAVCQDRWSSLWSDRACQNLGYAKSVFTEYKANAAARQLYSLAPTPAKNTARLAAALTNTSNCEADAYVEISCQDFTCGSHSLAGGVAARLVGGDGATNGQWPSVALLYHTRRKSSCTASIISPRWLVSSYSCLHNSDKGMHPHSWAVFAGGSMFDKGKPETQIKEIRTIVPYPRVKYNRFHFDGDLALVELDSPMSFNQYVGAICLPDKEIEPRQLCVTAGWGYTSPGEINFSQYLHYLPVPTIDPQECNSTKHYNGYITSDEICAGYTDAEKSPCYNDEGAPLMCVNEGGVWELHGVLSYHSNCGRGYHPSIFSSLTAVRSWIEKTVGNRFERKSTFNVR